MSIDLGTGSQDVWMLLDSGADFTTIPIDLAEALSGKAQSDFGAPTSKSTGLGGEVETWVMDGEARYLDRVFADRVQVNAIPRPVLGREDFMRVFNVQFKWAKNPPEFYVEVSETLTRPKNLGIRPKRR